MAIAPNMLGARVAARRRRLGKTQQDLAEMCGCGYRTIQRLERLGRASQRILVEVSECLDIPLGDLGVGKRQRSARRS